MPGLTDAKLRSLKREGNLYRIADANGLCIEIRPNGGRYWRYRYRFAGKAKMLSLGAYPNISLSAARQARDEARAALRAGKDPSETRQTSKLETLHRRNNSFTALANEWYAIKRPGWSDATAYKTRLYLDKDLLPMLGSRPIAEITRPELVEVLRRLEKREAFNVAKKARGWLNQIFRYSLAKGVLESNVATDLDVIAARAPDTKHHAHLSLSELPEFLQALEKYEGKVTTIYAIQLLLFTGVRPGELRKAPWAEFDLDKAEWCIPASRMKMRRAHVVPLPAQAVMILRALHAITGRGPLLFPCRDNIRMPMSENTVNQAFYRLGYKGKQTGHGFRHLISTALNEQGFNRDWIERQLAHGDDNEIRAVYNKAQYLNQRRKMMQTWANYLYGLAHNSWNVVPIRAA